MTTASQTLVRKTTTTVAVAAGALVLLVLAVYLPVRHAEFLSMDDTIYTLPPTPVGECFGDELRTARVPAPPFAPFHAQMEMRFGS